MPRKGPTPKTQQMWQNMKRGSPVCEEWRNDRRAFEAWVYKQLELQGLTLDDLGTRADKYVLDQIDPTKPHSPSNSQFILKSVHSVLKRTTKFVPAFEGEVKWGSQWARDDRSEVSRTTLFRRLAKEWTPEESILVPPWLHPEDLWELWGESKSRREWARDSRCQVSAATLYRRLAAGRSLEDAMSTPPRGSKSC